MKKSTKEQVEEYRQKVNEKFLSLLDKDSDRLNWIKSWIGASLPVSMRTGSEYSGINQIHLLLTQIEKGYDDPRWVTFNGLKKVTGVAENAHIKAGEHGTQIQFWMVNDTTKKYGEKDKYIDFKEAQRLIREEERDPKDFVAFPKYYTVFNAEQCEGVPQLLSEELKPIDQAEYVKKIAEGMGVEILYDGMDQAFYRPSTDNIHLPNTKYFKSEYGLHATTLHELAHSTGHPKRLNRPFGNRFGSEGYAKEELVAEITSCMCAIHLKPSENEIDEYIDMHSENHLAYVQSWKEAIKNDSEALEKAIKQATLAADFMDLNADEITLSEFKQMHRGDINVIQNEDGKYVVVDQKKAAEQETAVKHIQKFMKQFNDKEVSVDPSKPVLLIDRQMLVDGFFVKVEADLNNKELKTYFMNDALANDKEFNSMDDMNKALETMTPESLLQLENEYFDEALKNCSNEENTALIKEAKVEFGSGSEELSGLFGDIFNERSEDGIEL